MLAEVGDVEPLDPDRQLLEAERVRERLERVDRCWRRRSRRIWSCASASFALRSASSRRRRLSPRSATRTSTEPSRRLSSACSRSSVRSRIAGPSTTSRGTDGAAE